MKAHTTHVCDDGHDEASYDVKRCPVCKESILRYAAEAKVEELDEELGELKADIYDEHHPQSVGKLRGP